MSLLIDFVKTYPGLSAGLAMTLVALPWIIDLFIAVNNIRIMMGR